MHTKVKAAMTAAGDDWREVRHNAFSQPIRGPFDFAKALGYEPERITKTLFMCDHRGEVEAFAVCSVTKKAPLDRLAEALGVSRLEMAARDVLKARIGYPPTSVTPIGCEGIPVFMDRALLDLPTLLTGSGEPGAEIELTPRALQQLSAATLMDF